MAGAATIVKAVIEVEFDDLEKAQLALKKTGIEAEAFGKQAGKAKGGTAGLTQNIGDLSEALDKKLEKNLGRAFKATDRLQSIIGQMGTVVAVGTAVVGAFALGYKLLSDALNTGAANIKRAEEGLFDMAQAADIAKSALSDLNTAIANDEVLSIERAIKIAKVRQEISTKSAQFELFMKQIVIAESEKVGFFEIDVRKKIAQASAQINKSSFESAAEFRAQELRDLALELQRVKDMGEDFVGPIMPAAALARRKAVDTINKSVIKSARAVSKASKEAAFDMAAAWEDASFKAAAALDTVVSAQLDAAELQSQQQFLELLATGIDSVGLALDATTAKFDAWIDSAREASKASVDWTKVQAQTETQLQATGQAAFTAGLSAAIYGESVKGAVNDVLESIAIEALSRGIFEGAMGLGALAMGNAASAALHFASAAQFGAVGVAAGAGALATGGFDGPSDSGAGEAESGAAFTGAGDTGPARPSDTGPQETTVNVNLTAGSRPMLRVEMQQMGQELRNIMGAR